MVLDIAEYRLPLYATGVYFLVYYSWMILLLLLRAPLTSEVRKKLLENRKDKEKLTFVHFHREFKTYPQVYAADRAHMNMLEQMPPFLFSMWMYALFVDPTWAAYLCLAYTFIRCFYYVLYVKVMLLLPLVTFPNYGIILYMMASVIIKAL